MRDSWTEVGISDLLEVSIGGVWGGDPGTDEIDVCVYRQTEFDDNGTLSMPSDAVRSITKNQLKSRTLQPGDVLMQKSAGTPTLPGRVVIVPSEIERNATCSNFLHLLRADSTICDSHFLFWFLWFNHQSGRAFEFQRGTNIKNLDLNQYLAQQVLLPPLGEQKRIVDVVSSVDAYIDALQEQADTALTARNAVLHELLSAGGDDWTETSLGDIASWSSGKNLSSDKRHETGLVPILGANGIIGRTNEVLLDEELITVGRVGACGETHRSSGPVWISDNALIVIPTEHVTIDLLFYVLSTFDYQSIISGTTQPLITQSKMKSQVVNLPSLAEQKLIVEIVSSMDDVIQSTEQAVVDAKNLRSGLLSDLLSGEHEIPASYDSLLGAA